MDTNMTKEVILNLTGLEIFFISTTILSLFFNLYQLMVSKREKAALKAPLSNALIALFNDIKSKSTTVYEIQQFLFHNQNPHKDIETLRWEYFQFTKTIHNYLNGFQENLVGTLVTLNPDDKEGTIAFKAADYGLTQQEKEMRVTYMEGVKERQKKQLNENKP